MGNSRSVLDEEALFASNCNQDQDYKLFFSGSGYSPIIRGHRSHPRASRDVDEMTSSKHNGEHQR